MSEGKQKKESLTLKWGTLKGWDISTPSTFELLKKWHELGVSASAIAHRDTPEQRELVLQIIDAVNCDTIYLDWDGEHVSKEEAKAYVINYGNG